jgi:hypothetical protein
VLFRFSDREKVVSVSRIGEEAEDASGGDQPADL